MPDNRNVSNGHGAGVLGEPMRYVIGALLAVISITLMGATETSWPDIGMPKWALFLSLGKTPHHDLIHKFGFNPDVDMAATHVEIWEGTGPYPGFNVTAAEVVEMFSDSAADAIAGAGARTVDLRGLDANYDEITEVIELDGTTPVNSVNEYIRMLRVMILTAGATGVNVGTITTRQSVTTANVFSEMQPAYNQSQLPLYTVPDGKIAFVKNWVCSLHGVGMPNATCRLSWREPGSVFQAKEECGITAVGTSIGPRTYDLPKGPIPARSDIAMTAQVDKNDVIVYAAMDIIIVDE